MAVVFLKHHFSLAKRVKRLLQGIVLRKACHEVMGTHRKNRGHPEKPAEAIVEEYRESTRSFRKNGGIVRIEWRKGKEIVLLPEKPNS